MTLISMQSSHWSGTGVNLLMHTIIKDWSTVVHFLIGFFNFIDNVRDHTFGQKIM